MKGRFPEFNPENVGVSFLIYARRRIKSKSAIVNRQSEEVVVSVRGLTKVFKDFWNRPKARAVDNVDFEVRRGEVFGLLGPNGSGKSTTVKLLLGLLNPTKGHIEVFGHSPRHVQTKSRIGYLPEESYLVPLPQLARDAGFFRESFSSLERRTRTIARNNCWKWSASARRRRARSANFPRACSAASGWRRRSSTIPIW